ncbi:Suppressor of phya-105 1 protein [Gossypium arboreum]|uniref:Suppressor of phya-105 1 protein n=1 Tax=Gossypium arboreum TaxID=29729 RepID=A0A0B0NIA7_GOSAR|nr:Suppressor of phya-105 1 protein [Gossypium arboreum]
MSGTCISHIKRASVKHVWDMHRSRDIQASVRPVWDMASACCVQCKTYLGHGINFDMLASVRPCLG